MAAEDLDPRAPWMSRAFESELLQAWLWLPATEADSGRFQQREELIEREMWASWGLLGAS